MPHKQATPAKWSCPTGPSLHLNEWSPKFEDRLQAQLEAQRWQWAQRTQGVHEEKVLGSQWLIFKIYDIILVIGHLMLVTGHYVDFFLGKIHPGFILTPVQGLKYFYLAIPLHPT